MYQTKSTPVTATTKHPTEGGRVHDIIVDDINARVFVMSADGTEAEITGLFSEGGRAVIEFGCTHIKVTGATGGQVISWGE